MERIETQRRFYLLKPLSDFIREEAPNNNYTERLRAVFRTP